MNDMDRLYGLPGAEQLRFDIAEVYETEIDAYFDDPDRREWTVEEWTVAPARSHMVDVEGLLEWVDEWAAECGEISEGFGLPVKDADVVAAAEALLDLIASKVTWRMADRLVATHTITWDADNEPLLDGDIVERLRERASELRMRLVDAVGSHDWFQRMRDDARTCEDAADEIVRLRARLDAAEKVCAAAAERQDAWTDQPQKWRTEELVRRFVDAAEAYDDALAAWRLLTEEER